MIKMVVEKHKAGKNLDGGWMDGWGILFLNGQGISHWEGDICANN